MRQRTALPFQEERRQPDRQALDGALLDHLGSAAADLDTLYAETADLIEARLAKATRTGGDG
jgi:hypothetical protein